MIPRPDPMPPELADALATAAPRLGSFASRSIYFSTVGSTNDVASALASAEDAEAAVVIADAQTSGRGRRGRTWFSPPGAGLYVSVVLAPSRAVRLPDLATALLTLTAGVALAEGVRRATGLAPDIKWPNDLVIGRRKLAGILAEGVSAPASHGVQSVVLGYGLNVSAAAYPPELAGRVTALETELGRAVDRSAVCVETLVALRERYADLLDARFDVILDAWRARAPGSRGARVSWDTLDGPRTGITMDIDDSGALIVRSGDRLERLVAGEVRWEG
jgi:BirA family biotin operon repressor/biotin-[acetyl-CoA-carboxylase] ligase